MDGSTFLALYSVLFLMAVAGAWFVRRQLRVPDDDGRDGELHPYEHAYLQGGEARAIASCIAALQERDTVVVTGGDVPTIALTGSGDDPLPHPLDRAVVRALGARAPLAFNHALAQQLRALPELAIIREQLECRGLLLDASAAWPARFAPAAVMLALAGVGVVRMMHGLEIGKPIGLVALLVGAAVTIAVYFAASSRVIRSVRGDLALARIAGTFRAPHTSSSSSSSSAGTTHDMRVERAARLVAIEGPSAVPSLAAALGVLMIGTGFNVDVGGGDGGNGGGDSGGGGGGGGGGCGGCGGCG